MFKAEKRKSTNQTCKDDLEDVTILTENEMMEQAEHLNIFEKKPAVRKITEDDNPAMSKKVRLDQPRESNVEKSGVKRQQLTYNLKGLKSWWRQVERSVECWNEVKKAGKKRRWNAEQVQRAGNRNPLAWWSTWWQRMVDESKEEYRIASALPMKRTFVDKYFGGTSTTSQSTENSTTTLTKLSGVKRVFIAGKKRLENEDVTSERHPRNGTIAIPCDNSSCGANTTIQRRGTKRGQGELLESPAKRFNNLIEFWDGKKRVSASKSTLFKNTTHTTARKNKQLSGSEAAVHTLGHND